MSAVDDAASSGGMISPWLAYYPVDTLEDKMQPS